MPDVAHGLRANRNWLLLWSSQAFALFGYFVFNITVTLWVATDVADGQPWAPVAVAGVVASAAAPIILFGPIAGVFADRWDSRRTMMATDLIRVVLVALLILLPTVGDSTPLAVQLTIIYAAVTAISVCAQFFLPARFSLVASIIAKPDQSRAMSLLQTSNNTAAVLGPPVGAALFFSGAQWSLVVNAAALVVSFLLIRAIRTAPNGRQGEHDGFVAEFREGLRYFVGTPVLVVVVVAASIAMLGLGALNTLNVFFVEQNLGVDPEWLGSLNAGMGIGTIAGALLSAWLAARYGEENFFWLGLLLIGLSLIVYSRLTSLPVAIAVIALVGLPLGCINAVLGPLVLRSTPQELLGRMLTVINPSMQLASLGGAAIAGTLASTTLADLDVSVGGSAQFGPYDTVLLAAGLLVILSGLWALGRFRRIPSETSELEEAESAATTH